MHVDLTPQQAQGLCATRPVILVTTKHPNGKVNGGTFGSWTNLGSLQLGIAMGKASDTYRNSTAGGEFVVNIPGRSLAHVSELFGRASDKNTDDIALAGLTPRTSKHVSVPGIEECVAIIECQFRRDIEIGSHSFVIGDIVGGSAREEFIDDEGYFDVLSARVIHCYKYPKPLYLTFGEVIETK